MKNFEMDIREKVVQSFNEKLGSDLNNLDNLSVIHEQLDKQLKEIEESLSLASTQAPSKIKSVIKESEDICAKVGDIHADCNSLIKLISQGNNQNVKLLHIKDAVDKISEMEKALLYLELIKSVQDLSSDMEVSYSTGNDESLITSYMELTDIYVGLKSSACVYLVNFVHDTLHYWHNHIKVKLSSEYQEILKSLKWPFCGGNVSVLNASHNPENLVRFKILTEYLLNLQLPEDTSKSMTSNLVDFTPVSLPISLLVRPLKVRFMYHFTGYKQTNRRDKPEWFFTQVLTWIKDHADWVKFNVQPVAKLCVGFEHVDFKVEFMRAIVQMAVEKLHSELQVVQYDDSLFAHMVDEALGFEKELRETLFYPTNQPATVSVLTQAHIFVKWINMEKKYATEKMDIILSSETAWEMLTRSDVDEMKVTECADAFLTLLNTITDRYNHLPQPGHRLQFLELQLELIDDWRVRLLQLLHEDFEFPLNSLMPRILNSLYYVSSVLMDWGTTVHFLKLHFFKKQIEAVEIAAYEDETMVPEEITEEQGTVFDEAVDLLQRLERKLISEIVESVSLDVKAKSRSYRTDRWFSMQPEKEVSSLSLTPSGCPMFQELSDRLHMLNQVLALPLFKQAWRELATHLDQYFLEEVVLENKFNVGGAAQLQFDIFRNLFPLFGLYTNKPESYFPLMREACILLNLLLGSVILLFETLENKDENVSKDALAEMGIFKMSPQTAMLVLKTRMDISTR